MGSHKIRGTPSQSVAPSDDVQHDFVGPGADAVEALVAVGPLDLVFLHVAVAAEDLDALVGDLVAGPRGVLRRSFAQLLPEAFRLDREGGTP